MKFGSLFSGIGGFDLGFEQAGLLCSWQVELNGDCNRVLERHWSGVAKHGDVRDVGQLEPVDVICGGFPCQDLSVAGQRKGLAGERSGLWFEFLRIVGLNKPRWVVIENVPGLLSSDESRDFAAILRGLVECGYCLAWRVLDAQFYGVAQRRRRVFIVGSLGDGSCAEVLFESESVSWNSPTRREAGAGVAPTVRGGTASGSNEFGNKIGVLPANGGAEFREGDSSGVSGGTGSAGNSEATGAGRGRLSDVAATLDQRGRGPTDAVMMNLQIAGSLAAHSKAHGHAMTTQQAAESNHLVSMPLKAKANSSHDESHETYIYHENIDGKVYESAESPALRNFQKDAPMVVTHALNSAMRGATEDGTGRGTPLVVADTLGSSANRVTGKYGDLAPIAFGWNKSDSQTMRVDGETTDALQSSPQSNPAIAFSAGQGSKARSLAESVEHTPPLKSAESGLNRVPSISNGFGVRRLTPRECERLQSFPDDWTLYDAEGKQISDSARYRMLGNAICVNVAKWIGKRIMSMG